MRAPEFWSESGVLPRLLSPLGAAYEQHAFGTPLVEEEERR